MNDDIIEARAHRGPPWTPAERPRRVVRGGAWPCWPPQPRSRDSRDSHLLGQFFHPVIRLMATPW